jgi:cyclophilin family peptidyl-prolyl cis-trans isomerase
MGKLVYIISPSLIYLHVFISIHVVFGAVRQGQELVKLIENLAVDESSKPMADVTISHCGELMVKRKSNFFLNIH